MRAGLLYCLNDISHFGRARQLIRPYCNPSHRGFGQNLFDGGRMVMLKQEESDIAS